MFVLVLFGFILFFCIGDNVTPVCKWHHVPLNQASWRLLLGFDWALFKFKVVCITHCISAVLRPWQIPTWWHISSHFPSYRESYFYKWARYISRSLLHPQIRSQFTCCLNQEMSCRWITFDNCAAQINLQLSVSLPHFQKNSWNSLVWRSILECWHCHCATCAQYPPMLPSHQNHPRVLCTCMSKSSLYSILLY